MLEELSLLLDAVRGNASRADYTAAVMEENCLGKRTTANRKQHLNRALRPQSPSDSVSDTERPLGRSAGITETTRRHPRRRATLRSFYPLEANRGTAHPLGAGLNDGVRLNIRPFMAEDLPQGKKGAGVLRSKPSIHWKKDPGKEPMRDKEQFPWFWSNGSSTEERVNNVHWTKAERHAARDRAEDDYVALVKMLRSEGVADPNEYSHLAQDRQRLQSELANLNSIREEQSRLIEESQQYLRKVLECRRAVSERRDAFLAQALSGNRFVRIRNRRYGENPRIIEYSFREALGDFDHFERDILNMETGNPKGIVARLIENLPEDPTKRYREIENRIDHLKQRLAAACEGKGDFGGRLNNYLQRNFERAPEFLDKLLTWFPDDSLIVEYSRRGDGADFQPIAQASAGQRSAAMLAFLLAHGEEPLVLDQPEDDLDNYLIYDLVVRQIRENKLRRQIIVVTHNPNIVVNGDADMLHALDFRAGQCRVIQSGSLQEESIREEVCRIMEGGREAFERRYRRLRSESRHVR